MRACCYAYSLHALGIPQAMNFPLAPHRYPTIVSATALRMLALMLVLLAGAIHEQIAWDRKTAEEFPLDRGSRQRLVYGYLRTDAVAEAQAVVEELRSIDASDRWTRDLARLVNDYRILGNLGSQAIAGPPGKALQVRRNHLLWKMLPATIAETWAVEHAMPTEELTLSPVQP